MGIHYESYFDIVVFSALLMMASTLLKRRDFLTFIIIEFFCIMFLQTAWAIYSGWIILNVDVISRLLLHALTEICLYKAFTIFLRNEMSVEDELKRREDYEGIKNLLN